MIALIFVHKNKNIINSYEVKVIKFLSDRVAPREANQ